MTDLPIRAEAVEAAAKKLTQRSWDELSPSSKAGEVSLAEDAIAAFCEEEGLTVETVGGFNDDDPPSQRLVGKWRAVADD